MKLNKTLVILCLVGAQACNNAPENAQKYIESGEKYYSENNFAKARLEYKNALQLDNKLVDAYYHLALMDEKDKNWKGMFANLSQVVKLDPKHVDARLKLAQIYLISGQFDKTNEELGEIFKLSEDNLEAQVLKGTVLLRQGDHDGALKLAEKVLAVDPSNVEAISLKATVFQSQQNFVGALETLNQALKSNPDELVFNLLKLQIDTKRGDNKSIENDYIGLVKRFPEKQEFNYALIGYYASTKQFDKALAVIDSLIEKYPEEQKPKLAMVDLLSTFDQKKAEEKIKQYIDQNPGESKFYFRLVKLYIAQQRMDLAKKTLTEFIALNPEQKSLLIAKTWLAKFDLKEKHVDDAVALLNEVLEVDPRYFEALLLKVRIDMSNGLFDQAINQLRDISRDFSDSDEVYVLLGQAYLKTDAPELAEENFRKALELNPGNFDAALPVASRMIKSQDYKRAEDVLEKVLESKPDNAQALQMLAQVRLWMKDWSGSQEVADLIGSQPQGDAFSVYLSGKVSQGQGNYQDAIEKYKQALDISPKQIDALRGLLLCYKALNQLPEMMSYINEFIKKYPDITYPVLVKSELYVLDKKWDQALGILNEGIEKWPQFSAFYDAEARIYQQLNKTDQVIQTYQKGLENIPNDVRLRLYLASVYENKQDYQAALESYEELLKYQPENEVAINNLVSLLLDRFPNEANLARALELSQRFENAKNPFFLDSYGWALLKNGSADKALPVLEKVISMKSDAAVFQYHLGVAYAKSKMNDRAVSVLQKALELGESGKFVEKESALELLNKLKATDQG